MAMSVLALNGSPRRRGNSSTLLRELLRGARASGATAEELVADDLDIRPCRGCLRCNVLRRCALRGDQWPDVSSAIEHADVLVFVSPVYFHHVSASLKMIIDRFRSFIHVQLTEHGLKHTAWRPWSKKFAVIMCQGSSDEADARPALELFEFMTSVLGPENRLYTMVGTRLATAGQVSMELDDLRKLYSRLRLPLHLANRDYRRNRQLMQRCFDLGRQLAQGGVAE